MIAPMRLILLTVLTMIAFAANSVLNRLALTDASMGPAAFALIRLVAGAVVLAGLSIMSGGLSLRAPGRVTGVVSLAVYMLGFSFAYISLPAGLGALLLFGGVQVTMFAGAVLAKEPIPALRWAGSGVAFSGLAVLLWPGSSAAPALVPALFMLAAAIGWGIYSLNGRAESTPLNATAANFILAVPIAALVFAFRADAITGLGVVYAVLSGAITSGLGYALWYTILPDLGATRGAVAQLTVPLIAALGGFMVLAELPDIRFAIAAALVLGGVLLSMRAKA